MHIRIFLIATLFVSYFTLAAVLDHTAEAEPQALEGKTLNVVSWGGAYQMSQDKAYFTPFSRANGTAIKSQTHKVGGAGGVIGGLAKLANWDVADLTSRDAQAACNNGLLKPLEIDKILDGEEPGLEDFLPGAIGKCGIGSVAWSSVIVSNRRKFRKRQPKTIKHFFDVKRYPGKRALPNNPKYLLELALMADGVKIADVYTELDTADGEDRAFKKLEQLRDHVIWWERADESLKILEDGRAVMALAYNGRVFSEITAQLHPFDIIWDGQIYDIDYWVISKNSSNTDAALQFIRFAMEPKRMAEQASWFPYGPMRKSAVAMVRKHAELDFDMRRYIPTTPDHMKKALRLNTKWWGENEKRLKTRFDAWLNEGASDVAQKEAAKTE